MRSDLAVSENLHARSSLACTLEALEALCIGRFATKTHLSTCDLHKLLPPCHHRSLFMMLSNLDQLFSNYSTIPLYSLALCCSTLPIHRPEIGALRLENTLFHTKKYYFEYSSITLLGFRYSPNGLYSRSYPKDLGPPIAMPSFEPFQSGEHAMPTTVTR
jgi:hypothetical protein